MIDMVEEYKRYFGFLKTDCSRDLFLLWLERVGGVEELSALNFLKENRNGES